MNENLKTYAWKENTDTEKGFRMSREITKREQECEENGEWLEVILKNIYIKIREMYFGRKKFYQKSG